jgi:hypothetical protein
VIIIAGNDDLSLYRSRSADATTNRFPESKSRDRRHLPVFGYRRRSIRRLLRQAFLKRRCLIPADGFYEWRETAKPKLPFALRHERRTALHHSQACGKDGKIPNPENGCAPARFITGEPNDLKTRIGHPFGKNNLYG